MKRFFIILIAVCLFTGLSAQYTDIFKQTVSMEYEAFGLVDDYTKVIRGEEYVPGMDFRIVRGQYRPFILASDNNPFYYFAYAFTFSMDKQADSASFYFSLASDKADKNYAAQMRLFHLLYMNKLYNDMRAMLPVFENVKYKIGAQTIPEIAEYFNMTAVREYKTGNIDMAEEMLMTANRLDPFSYEIIGNLLKLSVKEFRFTNLGYIIKLYRGALKGPFDKFLLLYNAVKFTRYLFFALFIIMTIVLFVKNIEVIFFAIGNGLNKWLNGFQKKVVTVFILALPLILEINPIIYFLYMSFINFFFIRRREKILMGILLLFIVAMPFVFNIENHIIGKLNPDDNLSVISRVSASGWDNSLLNKINRLIEEQPLNNGLFFGKAMLYKKGGYFNEAEQEYNKILLTGEKNAEIYNNLGNIMYFKGFYAKAREYYEKAIELQPKAAYAHFNLAQTYIRDLQLTKSNELLTKASQLDFDEINSFMENSVEGYFNTELIDATIPEQYLWEEFMKRTELRDTPVMMGVNISILAILALISMLLSAIFGSIVKHKSKIERCFTCGRVMHADEAVEYNEKHVCKKCGNMLEGTVSDSLRARKYESFLRMKMKNRNRLSKIGSFIFPGVGKIFQERLMKGTVLVLLAAMTTLLFFSDSLFIMRNPHAAHNIQFNNNIILAVLLFIFYLISIGITKEEK